MTELRIEKGGIEEEKIPTLEEFKEDGKAKIQIALCQLMEVIKVPPAAAFNMLNMFWLAYNNVKDEEIEIMYNVAYGDSSMLPTEELKKVEIARVH